jgi:hypothetical protein
MEKARKRFDTALEEARDASGINDFIVQRDEAFAERDAAIRERESLREQLESVACRAATAENRVAELEARTSTSSEGSRDAAAASGGGGEQPRGWLTEEERKWIEYMKGNSVLPYAGMACMEAILDRSSPREVVLPGKQVRYHSISVEDQRDSQWIAALAAAGVAVKEVGRE